MKRILMIATILFMSSCPLSAGNYLQSLSSAISDFGQSIENIDNVPAVGKLVNILPVAMVAAGLKQCPLQAMAVFAAWCTYKLSQNQSVRKMIGASELVDNRSCLTRNQEDDIDENIFVFEGNQEEASSDNFLDNTLCDNQQLQSPSDKQSFLSSDAI